MHCMITICAMHVLLLPSSISMLITPGFWFVIGVDLRADYIRFPGLSVVISNEGFTYVIALVRTFVICNLCDWFR